MMLDKRLIAKNEEAVPGSRAKVYAALVNQKIRARYSQSAENAILRKAIAGVDRTEFEAYNAFAEECKAAARAELGMEEVS